jgi:hypothetical protein
MNRTIIAAERLDDNLNYIKPLHRILCDLIGVNDYRINHYLNFKENIVIIQVLYRVKPQSDNSITTSFKKVLSWLDKKSDNSRYGYVINEEDNFRELIQEFPFKYRNGLFSVLTNNFDSIRIELKKQIKKDKAKGLVVGSFLKTRIMMTPPNYKSDNITENRSPSRYRKINKIRYACPRRLQSKLNRLIALGFDINNTIDLDGEGKFEAYVNS